MAVTSIQSNISGVSLQMSGATTGLSGTSGSTSTPVAGDQTKFQSGGGGFATPTLTGAGTPESVVIASIGNQYFDTTANVLYIKKTGGNTTTGWIATAQAGTWVSYTPIITATSAGTNPTLPTSATITGSYSVVGKIMHLNIKYFAATTAGGVNGTQSYQYSLPVGYVIDTTKAAIPSVITDTAGSGLDGGTLGSGFGRNATASNSSGLIVMPLSTTSIGAYFEGQTRLIGAGSLAMTGAANTTISMICQIPLV